MLFNVRADGTVHVADTTFDFSVSVVVAGPLYHTVDEPVVVINVGGTYCGSVVEIVSSERQNSLNLLEVNDVYGVGTPVAIARGDSLHFANVSAGMSNMTLCSRRFSIEPSLCFICTSIVPFI